VSSSIESIDRLVGGLQGFVGLVGEPAVNKSTLMLQMALHNASLGIPVYFIDIENGESLTIERALCNLANRSWRTLFHEGVSSIKKWYQKLSELPFFYLNEAIPFEQLKAEIAEMHALSKNGIMILCIDSLQSLWNFQDDLRIGVDKWLLNLDALRLLYDNRLIIFTTIEKKRDSYGTASKSAGKESGRIEYKLCQQLDIREENEELFVTCTKNRYGCTGGNIRLKRVLENPADAWSFTFRMADVKFFL